MLHRMNIIFLRILHHASNIRRLLDFKWSHFLNQRRLLFNIRRLLDIKWSHLLNKDNFCFSAITAIFWCSPHFPEPDYRKFRRYMVPVQRGNFKIWPIWLNRFTIKMIVYHCQSLSPWSRWGWSRWRYDDVITWSISSIMIRASAIPNHN